ncbi:uncharacterized protein LOC141589945 [Silene latifolia]|uniref:uncharacterized protein LOC141589945 n=1 Tax=Silene latifolia TaxID=37657 RepID=UPI003D77ADA7
MVGLFGLLETKVKPLSLNSVRINVCDGWSLSTNTSYHPGGRVWVLWNPSLFYVHFVHYSAQSIHMKVTEISSKFNFFCTMVYAFNDTTDTKSLWHDLCSFADSIHDPWILCGDFNCVLKSSERLGGLSSDEEMKDFHDCLDYCQMMDSPAAGSYYTWNNNQEPQTRVYSRLNRVLVNNHSTHQRPNAYAHFYNEGIFYHTPCIIQEPATSMKGRRSFKYFNMWSQVADFKPCIPHHWNQPWKGNKMFQVVMKLKSLKRPLKDLNKVLFDDIENSAVHAWKILDNIQDQLRTTPGDPTLLAKEKEAHGVYRELQAACDSFLTQKSKATWVNQGDNNTRYFHSLLRARSAKNKVFLIEDTAGNVHSDGSHIQSAFLKYYEALLGTAGKEIKEALFSIPNHKAPGPDGFSSAFFKDSWSVVGDEVCAAILDFFQSVISKVLCTRLSSFLPFIVSKNQGGFVKGRSIVENILICQDLVRLYNKKTVSPRCLMKIDLKKGHDSVHWDFVEQMLTALNFPTKFIQLVMICVRTASYSLVLNGENFGYFKGAKGLRQGDPISPLLFTITMEYLSRILTHVTATLPFKFHPLCSHLKLSHLMFADDLLLFSKGDTTSIMILLRAFATFSVATGLQMNSMKSNIYFYGVASSVKLDILRVSGFSEGVLPFKYLGVPISAGRLSVKNCSCLIEKITEKIHGYAAKKLSYAGRLTLVNSVLTTLYTYWASIFILPKGVLRRIDALCRNYLWDGSTEYVRSPLVSWEKVCVPKDEGGLGIRHIIAWNLASICKLSWWIYSNQDSLWVQWVHHIYMKDVPWSLYTPKHDSPWTWKTICKVKDKFSAGFSSTRLWLPCPSGYSVSGGYQWIRQKQPTVTWNKVIWNSWCISKHSFISWLIAREALQLKDKLFLLGIIPDDVCFLSGSAAENHQHLFTQCCYTRQLFRMLSLKLNICLPMPRPTVGTRQSKRGRASEPEVGEGSGPVVPAVPEYLSVVFVDFAQRKRFVALQGRKMRPTQCIDTTLLTDLGIETDVRHIFESLGMTGFYHLRKHSYAFLTLEFMSSFKYEAVEQTMEFRLMSTNFVLTMDLFASHLGLAKPAKGALRDIPSECGVSSLMPCPTGKPAPTSSNILINDVQHVTLNIFLHALTCLL